MLNYSESNKSKSEFCWRVIQVIIAIFFVFLFANEIVQPFFFPRVTDIEINPLNIQSEDITNYENISYYIIYEVKYKVLPPLLLVPFGKTELRIPGGKSDNIEIAYSLQENNPYYELVINKQPYKTFISSSNLSGVFPIKITTSAIEIKNIEIILIIREKIDSNSWGSIGASSSYLWTGTRIKPIISKGDFYATSNPSKLGYALKQSGGAVFKIDSIDVKNLKELEIFGLAIKIGEVDVVCDENINVHIIKDFVLVGLKPNEDKRLLLIKHVGGPGYQIPKYMKSVSFTGDWDDCSTYNQVYKKLLGDT